MAELRSPTTKPQRAYKEKFSNLAKRLARTTNATYTVNRMTHINADLGRHFYFFGKNNFCKTSSQREAFTWGENLSK